MTHPLPDDDDAPDSRLAALLADAAALPELRPTRDLWPGIAARLDAAEYATRSTANPAAASDPTGARVLAFRASASHRAAAPSRARWLAAAAALAMLSSAATYHIARRPGPTAVATIAAVAATEPDRRPRTPNDPLNEAPDATPGPPAPAAADDATRETLGARRVVAQRADARTEQHTDTRTRTAPRPALQNVARSVDAAVPGAADYDREIGLLRAAVADHHGDLDSSTVAVLARNLQIIDAAIAASRAALAHDPRSPFLGEQLTRALGQKVELLRTAALLPRT